MSQTPWAYLVCLMNEDFFIQTLFNLNGIFISNYLNSIQTPCVLPQFPDAMLMSSLIIIV